MASATVGTNAFGLDVELYTRGTGDDKPRGESLVQKHLDKLQQEKENLAMEKLAALMPQMGPAVRVLALKEAVFDVETAIAVLRSFQSQNDEALKALHKKRKKLKETEVDAVKEAEERAAAVSSSSEEASGSGSDDSDDDTKSRKHKKKGSSKDGKKRKRSGKDSTRSSKSKKRKRRAADSDDSDDSDESGGGKKSKGKKDKAVSKTARTNTENFGRFGIIRETDMMAKRGEFLLWAVEVKKVDPETIGRQDERELFKDFMEDFNTGTMPHRKYYNLEIYQREKLAKEARKQGKKPAKTKPSALDDEEALRREREAERQKQAAERLQQAYAELQATDKARDMREQEMLRLQMQAAYKAGDKKTAEQIFKRLMPEEERKAKGIK